MTVEQAAAGVLDLKTLRLAMIHLVALTHHPKGDEYLVDLAKAVDAIFRNPRL